MICIYLGTLFCLAHDRYSEIQHSLPTKGLIEDI